MNNGMNAVIFFLALFLFVMWFYGPWKNLCIDWARQRTFESRNAIFDMARDGKISFDSVEYREIRHGLEGLIRFTHRVSWPTLILMGAAIRVVRPSKGEFRRPDEWAAKIKDESVRSAVKRHILKAEMAVIGQMVLRSIPLMIIVSVVLLAACFSATLTAIVRRMASIILVNAISAAEQDDEASTGHRRVFAQHSM